MRVLTWEAASIRSGPVPGEAERQQRIAHYATEIRLLRPKGSSPGARAQSASVERLNNE